jgi:hypothetical protein
MDTHVAHCQPESEVVSALQSVYVACMLRSIYEYRQNMAAVEVLHYSGEKNITRGTFAAQYVHLFYPFIYERTVPISVSR